MRATSFESRNSGVREPNVGPRRAAAVVVVAWLTAACGGTTSPTSPGSPAPGVTPFPPGDPFSLAPYLVRDIRPGPDSSMSEGYAGQFFPFRGRVLSVADDGEHGLELWETDGRGRGTAQVAPIEPDPWTMVDWRGRLFLSARDERYGQEPWATDGRAEGTAWASATASSSPRRTARPARSSGPIGRAEAAGGRTPGPSPGAARRQAPGVGAAPGRGRRVELAGTRGFPRALPETRGSCARGRAHGLAGT